MIAKAHQPPIPRAAATTSISTSMITMPFNKLNSLAPLHHYYCHQIHSLILIQFQIQTQASAISWWTMAHPEHTPNHFGSSTPALFFAPTSTIIQIMADQHHRFPRHNEVSFQWALSFISSVAKPMMMIMKYINWQYIDYVV